MAQNRIAGRPALYELKEDQRKTIEKLREGFNDEQEVTDWIFEVSKVTLGFLDEGTKALLSNRILHRVLLMKDKPWYQGFVEQLAKRLIMAFDQATREIAIRSGEERDKRGIAERELSDGLL